MEIPTNVSERGKEKMKGKITETVNMLTELYNSIEKCNDNIAIPIMIALRNMEKLEKYLDSKGEK